MASKLAILGYSRGLSLLYGALIEKEASNVDSKFFVDDVNVDCGAVSTKLIYRYEAQNIFFLPYYPPNVPT